NAAKDPVARPALRGTTRGPSHGTGLPWRSWRRTACEVRSAGNSHAGSSMASILIAECIHEVCSFNPVPTRYEDFATQRGRAHFEDHRHLGSEVGGALEVFQAEPGLELRPAFGARGITSGGTIALADFERLAGEFLGAIREAGPVDGAYFALHGAMASTQEEDPEGYF